MMPGPLAAFQSLGGSGGFSAPAGPSTATAEAFVRSAIESGNTSVGGLNINTDSGFSFGNPVHVIGASLGIAAIGAIIYKAVR